jgi:GNAT superfamily N-acetyltransferase
MTRGPARRPGAGPGGIRIRRARPADRAALATLMAASPLLRSYGLTRGSALRALGRAHAARDQLTVAVAADGRVCGVAWVLPSRVLTGAAYLRLLLVAEGRRRAGTGQALLAAAEEAARSVSNHLALLVSTRNIGARRFYTRHGYRNVGRLPGLARPGLDEALYWKTLRPHGRRLPV